MWVQMLEGISGGRPGGGAWPPRGYLLEVEDWEGDDLIRKQLATPASGPEPVAAPAPSAETPAIAEESEKPATPVVSDPDVPEPSPADMKAVWVAYAVSQGANQAEAESLTKTQLQSAYGGRL